MLETKRAQFLWLTVYNDMLLAADSGQLTAVCLLDLTAAFDSGPLAWPTTASVGTAVRSPRSCAPVVSLLPFRQVFSCALQQSDTSLFTLCALCHKGRYWVRVFLFSTRRTLLTKWSNTNDICYSKYADDLTAVISDFATSEFGHIQDWSSANRLHINISKTKEMIIFRP